MSAGAMIPLAAAAVAMGYKPASANVMLARDGFPVPVHYGGRYRLCSRSDVEAWLEAKARPYLTRAEYGRILGAHAAGVDKGSICLSPEGPAVEVLSRHTWLSVPATAQLLGMTPAALVRKSKTGALPLKAEHDPLVPGWLKVRSWEVTEYLASREPRWPTVQEFAAEPSLNLAEVKAAAGDTNPAGPGDPATRAYLQVRDTITLADFAIMSGISQDAMRRRAQRGKVELVDTPTAAGSIRRHKAVPSKYAAEAMNVAPAPME